MRIENFELRDIAAVRKYFRLDQVVGDVSEGLAVPPDAEKSYQIAHKVSSELKSSWGTVSWFTNKELVELTSLAMLIASKDCENDRVDDLGRTSYCIAKRMHCSHIFGHNRYDIDRLGGEGLFGGRTAILAFVYKIMFDWKVDGSTVRNFDKLLRDDIIKYLYTTVNTLFGPLVSPLTRGVTEGDVIEGVLRHSEDDPSTKESPRMFCGLFNQYDKTRIILAHELNVHNLHSDCDKGLIEVAVAANYVHDYMHVQGYENVKAGVEFIRRLAHKDKIIHFLGKRQSNRLDRMVEVLDLMPWQTEMKMSLVLSQILREFTVDEIACRLRGDLRGQMLEVHSRYARLIFDTYEIEFEERHLFEGWEKREERLKLFMQVLDQATVSGLVNAFYPLKIIGTPVEEK